MPEAQKATPPSGAINSGAQPTGEPKAKKEPKPKAESTVNRTNFSKLYPEDAAVKLLVAENPKKKGSKSRERFEGYTGAKTVGDALAKGVTYQDIVYDVGHGFIQVG